MMRRGGLKRKVYIRKKSKHRQIGKLRCEGRRDFPGFGKRSRGLRRQRGAKRRIDGERIGGRKKRGIGGVSAERSKGG